MKLLLLFLSLTLAILGQSVAAQQISTEMFARLPDVTMMTISPNGNRIASLVRYEEKGVRGVVVYTVNLATGEKKVNLSTDNSKYVINWMVWANDSTLLVSARYPTRIYQTKITATNLLRVDVNSGEVTSAIPPGLIRKLDYVPIAQDRVIDMLPDSPDEFLISLRASDAVASAVYRINHKTGESKRLHRSRENTLDWLTDRQHNLRLANYISDDIRRTDHRLSSKQRWQPLFQYKVFGADARVPLGFDHDPNTLFYRALHDGKDAVYKMNVADKSRPPELVYAHSTFDAHGSLIYSEKFKRVVGLSQSYGDGYVFWDPSYQQLQKTINNALPDTNNKIIGFSRDEKKFLILATSDTEAGIYYLWDRDSGLMSVMAYRYKNLPGEQMEKKQRISYQARDGLTINGYLTRPKQNSDQPSPAIVFPHGGPISHDGKGFDYWTQFFANSGYTVLQMNFRGSSGYGYDFMKSGLRDWGGKMQTDVEDGTRWLIKEGIADPDKICIVGASYGGYAALMEAANNPSLYQCAVSFAGVTDLPQLLSNSRRYIHYESVKEQLGSNRRELKKRSPVSRAKEISIPVLLSHGTKDQIVPVLQSKRMYKRLKKAGNDVTYQELEDGSHYLSNEEHRVSFFHALEAFLQTHLGGP